jgi:hypothetical protein
VARRPSLSLALSALATSAALVGCGAGSGSATESTRSGTVGGTGVSHDAREPIKRRQPDAQPLTLEEMREYDANEGRCKDDRGSVRNAGTIGAYCSFPARSNDFHLIESSHEQEPADEEE